MEETLVDNPQISRTRNLSRMFKYVQEGLESDLDGQGTRWDAWGQHQAAGKHGENTV